jgi:hypothetical protein
VEISTVVSRQNKDHLVEVGEWLFEKNPRIFWRLDEYYANGAQSEQERETFELTEEDFERCKVAISESFGEQYRNRQIRFSTKESRLVAPDYMITPQGNYVTSSENDYVVEGDSLDLLFVELKNRRGWAEYRDCIRTDWVW